MAVINITKDGTVLQSIAGHVVRFEDAEPIYRLIAERSKENEDRKEDHKNVDMDCRARSGSCNRRRRQ